MFLLKEIFLINSSLILSLVKKEGKMGILHFSLSHLTTSIAQFNNDYANHTRSGTYTLAQPQANDKVTTTRHPIREDTSHADFAVINVSRKSLSMPRNSLPHERVVNILKRTPIAPSHGITNYLEGLATHEGHEKELFRCGYIYS
ncbi:hypothetical protein PABG_02335 [Paracoccidioides brasiliensis Pb03]|nr:hypothetical protein PABG_02335 [Paracoccidioides brasiliensis Pb03]